MVQIRLPTSQWRQEGGCSCEIESEPAWQRGLQALLRCHLLCCLPGFCWPPSTARAPHPSAGARVLEDRLTQKRRPLVSQSKVVLSGADLGSEGKGVVVCPIPAILSHASQSLLSFIFVLKAPNKSDWHFAQG